MWLYPTRAIRRKNLAELLLLAAIAAPGEHFATTRGPENPRQRARYLEWRALAAELRLPVTFEVGPRHRGAFAALLAGAYGLVSTSVSEGFGLAFLEPWSVGRPMVGRALPEITDEFQEAGVDLMGLYRRLDVPVCWIGSRRLRCLADQVLRKVLEAYGREVSPDQRERVLHTWVRDEVVDFGRLDETAQEQVVRKVVGSPEAAAELSGQHLALPEGWPEQVRRNRQVVAREYSLESYGKKLRRAYQALAGAPCGRLEALDGASILDGFLAPERLIPLCS
jgi:glycosyltransferase involved in cell wall biosynthesis